MTPNQPQIKFYRVADLFGQFSNFAPYPVEIDGQFWPTSEHYFQAQKFSDARYREEIRSEPSPMKAAKMGRDRSQKLRDDWEEVKDDVMYRAVLAKFSQHQDLLDLLLGTGDAEIIEHTENDRYWGDGGDGNGLNRLGEILMTVREELTVV